MSFKLFKELLKTAPNGQWSLEKAWVDDEDQSTPAKNLRAAYPTMGNAFHPDSYKNTNKVLQTKNKIALDDMMDLASKGGIPSSHVTDFIKKAPKGSIDFGHVFDKIKKNPSLKNITNQSDFMDGLSHHLDGVRDLKDIHDHHGGLDAVEGILKNYHGHGGESEYIPLHLGKNNQKLIAESNDLMNPGKGGWMYDPRHDIKEDDGTQLDPAKRIQYEPHFDPDLNKEVADSWENTRQYDGPDFESGHSGFDTHQGKVLRRAMDAFKKYHKL
jgi:hypothetical protein